MATVVRNGTIVTSSDQFKGDILIEGDKIKALGSDLADRADQVIEAEGKYVFPGGVDGHTHFALPFMGTTTAGFETTTAALAGGTTTVINFVPQPAGLSLMDALAKHLDEDARGRSAADFAMHAMVNDTQEGMFGELPALVKAGVPTVKLFMAYKGTPFYSDDATIFRMLEKSKEVGVLTMLHCENGDIIDTLQKRSVAEGKIQPRYHAVTRPTVAEEEATSRGIALARAADAPVFVVHISCAEAMAAVRNASLTGAAAFGETCPHYLVLDMGLLSKADFEGAKYVCSPPLRETRHQEQLWKAIQLGWLQVVGSDHCGFNYRGQKEMGREDFTMIPNGAPGVENRLSILYTYGVAAGKLSLQRLVDVFATSPAKLYGMYPKKGALAAGADADLVIFDPHYEGTISAATSLQGVDFNAYEGFRQKGRAEKVLLRGEVVVDGGRFVGRPGGGKFVERAPYGSAYAGRG